MNKKVVFIFGCLVFSFVNFNNVNSLTNTKAKVAAVACSLATSVALAGASYGILKNSFEDWNNPEAKNIITGGFGIAGLGLGYLLFDHIFSQYTPSKRVHFSEAVVYMIETDSLFTQSFNSVDDLVMYVNARFATSWPLLLARERLVGMLNSLGDVLILTQKSEVDAINTSEYQNISGRCKALRFKLPAITKEVERKIDLIVRLPDYYAQRELFERYQEAERQRAFEANQRALDRLAKYASKPVVTQTVVVHK